MGELCCGILIILIIQIIGLGIYFMFPKIRSGIEKFFELIFNEPLKSLSLSFIIIGLIFINKLHEWFINFRGWFRWVAVFLLFFGVVIFFFTIYRDKKEIKKSSIRILQLYVLVLIYNSFESVVNSFSQVNNPGFFVPTKILGFFYLLSLFILFGVMIQKLE